MCLKTRARNPAVEDAIIGYWVAAKTRDGRYVSQYDRGHTRVFRQGQPYVAKTEATDGRDPVDFTPGFHVYLNKAEALKQTGVGCHAITYWGSPGVGRTVLLECAVYELLDTGYDTIYGIPAARYMKRIILREVTECA